MLELALRIVLHVESLWIIIIASMIAFALTTAIFFTKRLNIAFVDYLLLLMVCTCGTHAYLCAFASHIRLGHIEVLIEEASMC